MDNLKEIQKICLEIMKDIDCICRKHKINYSLCGGSVIGAKLYEGFIPWDDDIDIMMERSDYEKFLKIYPTECKNNYKLVNFYTDDIRKLPTLFSRVIDENSKTEELVNNQKKVLGNVFVDITVYDGIKSKFDFKFKELQRNYVYMYYYKLNNIIPGNKIKKLLLNFVKIFINVNKYEQKAIKYDKKISKLDLKKTKYCSEMLSTIFPGKLYTSNIFNEYVDINFESQKFMIIKEYDEYLYQRYGRRTFTKDNREGYHRHIKLVDKEK